MTPHPKRSPATIGVGMKRPPTGVGRLGLIRRYLAEEQPEAWPSGTKLRR